MSFLPGVIFITITILTGVSIILRSVFGINIIGYYELISILSGIAIILSLITAEKKSAHVLIDIVPYPDWCVLSIIRKAFTILIYAVICSGQFWAAYESWHRSYITTMLEFPTWLAYGLSGVVFLMLTIVTIRKCSRGNKC
ncbi:hypothetical protein N9N97_01950 [Rickettsiaceae bacterium]|nr:hypothetical protein [Rickettsiaceae bacterium]